MPTSHFYQLDQLVEVVYTLNPKRTLDVGFGFGKYGFLTREYVDLWHDGSFKKFKRVLDGIEAYKSYISPVHKYLYNNIYVGEALGIVQKLNKSYDLVLLIDVLEHFNRRDGLKLLKLLVKKSRYILISTPIKMSNQGSVFGNIYERHLHQWGKKDLKSFQEVTFLPNHYSHICLIGVGGKALMRKMFIARVIDWIRYLVRDS